MPGIGLAFRADDDGNLGFRLNVAYDSFGPSVRHRVDNDSDRIGTTYAVEFGDGPNLRDVFPSGRNYPELHWKGPVAYRRYGWFDDRPRMISRLNQINEIAQDPEVEGIILNLSGMQASVANLWEIRAQLAGMRAQGKKVIVYFDRLGASGYMLASVADEIWIDPMGGISLSGINFGRSYYSRMLEKIGIGFDEWRFFKYKSAAESFSRTEFSEGEKEQLTDLMNDFYGSVVEEILEGRGIAREDWDQVVNTMGELLPEEAERLGLVDGIGDFNDLRVDAHNVVARPGTDSHTAPIGPVLGDRIWRGEEWGEAPRIAVLYAIGPCEMDGGIRGRQLSKLIRQMREDPKVKAVVLRADSPGGDPLPSDLVARELKLTAEVKPVIVSQGQVAGSGGYWISMYGDEIHASPFTVTGSIGVISGHMYDNGLMDRLGIDYDHVQIGDSADLESGPSLPLVGIGLPHRPPTDAERARVKEVILDLYETFMEEVAEGRHLEMDTVRDLAQGRIYSGTRGQEIGLVDEIGGLWSAIVRAKQLAGLDGDDRIRIVEGPQLGLFPPNLLSPSLIAARAKAQWAGEPDFQPLAVAADLASDSEAMPSIFEDVVSDEQWAAMPVLERLYLLRMLKSSGRASVMMDPIDLGEWMGELR